MNPGLFRFVDVDLVVVKDLLLLFRDTLMWIWDGREP